jgi:16S rRNA (cytosine1402-N4)-methyltransferase
LHQINSIDRGFSFTKDSPLDMRMNRKNLKNAKQIVNEYEKDVLTKIFFEYGEEPFSKKIAYNIVKYRENKSINTTGELSKIIENSVLKKYSNKSKARIFQAIRIEVNNELNVLESTLKDVTELLDKNARLLVISWHSLEDRIVKRVFRETIGYCRCPKELNQCLCKFQPTMKLISKKAITPSEKEIQINHNARSAKLRIIEKV